MKVFIALVLVWLGIIIAVPITIVLLAFDFAERNVQWIAKIINDYKTEDELRKNKKK